ncbi:MAG: hypothetical protein ACO3LZ_09305 [Candidatus Nanopelagicales bacterium]
MGNGGRFLGAELEQFKQDVLYGQNTGEPLTHADGTIAAALMMVVSRLEDITGQLERLNESLNPRKTRRRLRIRR